MNKNLDHTHTSQRRRLLKGALAASSVATLGYGGSAAAASLGCMEKIADNGGGYPGPDYQFALGSPPEIRSGRGWAWEQVPVHKFQRQTSSPTPPPTPGGKGRGKNGRGNGQGPATPDSASTETTYAFQTREGFYYSTVDHRPFHPEGWVQDFTHQENGWVLAYFNLAGERIGSYPAYQSSTTNVAPASASCLASVNPNIPDGRFTFGG